MREGFEINLWVKSRVNVMGGVYFLKSLLFYFSGINLNGVKILTNGVI